MDEEFQGNEPQPAVHVPPEMMTGHHVSYGIPEPGIGTVIQFDSHKDDRSYAAIRTGDGWYVAGQRGKHTWSDLLADVKDPVIVMQPAQLLHP